MLTAQDIYARLEALNDEAIASIASIVELCRDAAEEDPEAVDLQEILDRWADAADEHGWNPAVTSRLAKGIVDLCKQGE